MPDESKYADIPDGVAREIPVTAPPVIGGSGYGGGGPVSGGTGWVPPVAVVGAVGHGGGGRNENQLIKVSVKVPDRDHETRELQFRLKQLGKANGRQGETIHRLRAELAEAQAINTKIDRGQLRNLERMVLWRDDTIRRLRYKLGRAMAENKELQEKLAAAGAQIASLAIEDPDPHLWAAQHEGENA